MAYLKSITTGSPVSCDVNKRSFWRRLFFLPSIQVSYIYESLAGPIDKTRWRYPSEVYGLDDTEPAKDLNLLQSENEALEAQSVQGMANKVCGDLPDGWVINLCMENGAAWVEAIKPSGYTIEIDGADMSLVEQIDEALKQAFANREHIQRLRTPETMLYHLDAIDEME